MILKINDNRRTVDDATMMTVEWVHDSKGLKTGPGDAVLTR